MTWWEESISLSSASSFHEPPLWALQRRIVRRMGALLGKDWAIAYLFVGPAVLLMGGLIAYPFLRALLVSFTRTRGLSIGPFVGLANYRKLWGDRFFRESVGLTWRLTFWVLLIKFVIAMLGAILLHRLGPRANPWMGLLLLPWITPQIARAIIWKGLLDPLYGGLNRLLLDLGLIEHAIPFLGQLSTALPSVITVYVWQGLPFFIVNLLAGLKAIDQELYEAAAIDGASRWRQFLHVTLPGIRYILLVILLLDAIWTFNSFELIFLITGGGPMNATKVYSVLAYSYARIRLFGSAAAVAMSVAPVFALCILVLGGYMLAAHRPQEGDETTAWGLLGNLWRAMLWPIVVLLKMLLLLFWVLNDGVERLLALLGRLLRRALGRDRTERRAQRRLGVWFIEGAAVAALTLLLVFELGPFYWVLVTAFKSELQITRFESVLWPHPWTLEQFHRLLGPARNFMVWLRNTMLVSGASTVLSTFFASLSAYALTRLRWRGSHALTSAVMISYLMPPILLVIPIQQLFTRLGLMNSLASLIASYPTLLLPFAMWLLMGYYASIPEELEAAAMVDGCGRLQIFFHIVWPLSKPAILAVTLFGIIQAWNEFLFAYTFIVSESKMTLPVGLAQMIFGDVLPWGELCAAALILVVPTVLVYGLGQRFMVAGLTAGAVKGGG